jgi:hypothetical protein
VIRAVAVAGDAGDAPTTDVEELREVRFRAA